MRLFSVHFMAVHDPIFRINIPGAMLKMTIFLAQNPHIRGHMSTYTWILTFFFKVYVYVDFKKNIQNPHIRGHMSTYMWILSQKNRHFQHSAGDIGSKNRVMDHHKMNREKTRFGFFEIEIK